MIGRLITDLEAARQLDRTLVVIADFRTVIMPAIGVAAQAGVETKAVGLRRRAGRRETDPLEIEYIVAAVKHRRPLCRR